MTRKKLVRGISLKGRIQHASPFTLIELLIAIAVIVILAGIGVRGYKRAAGEMALHMAESQIRQLVQTTISDSKKNKIPLQIQVYLPSNIQKDACIIKGGTASLVGYWGFDGFDVNKGLRNVDLLGPIQTASGYLGLGVAFDGGTTYRTKETNLLDFNNNVYVEVMVKPDIEAMLNGPEVVEILNGNNKLRLQLKKVEDKGMSIEIEYDGKKLSSGETIFPEDGGWHKLAVSLGNRENNSMTLYLDDLVLVRGTTINADPNLERQKLSIGKHYVGLMDEIRVFSIASGLAVYLNPRDTYMKGFEKGGTSTINFTALGTLDGVYDKNGHKLDQFDHAVPLQICSSKLIGSLESNPSSTLNGQIVKIKKIKSSFPNNGYLSIGEGELVKYTWSGDKDIKLDQREVFKSTGSTQIDFCSVRPIVIRRNGVVQ